MRKILIIWVLIISSGKLMAQDVYITAYGGYVFDDSFDSYYDSNAYYEGKIKGGLQWGIGAEYKMSPYTGIELTYYRQDTDSPTTYRTFYSQGVQRTTFDLGINYILLGGNRYFTSPDAPFQGFGGLMAGVVFADLHNPELDRDSDATKFSWGAKLGGVYWMSDYIGIKLQAQLLSAVQAAGGGFYFSTYGPQTGVTTYSTIYQFTLGGGLVFSLN